MAQPANFLNVALDFLKTSYKFDTFQEPRGVMRIFQFVFGIWGFFAVRDFSFNLKMDCQDLNYKKMYVIDYPFEFAEHVCRRRIEAMKTDNTTIFLSVDASTSAQFFALTAVLSLLYALFIIFVYCYLDEMYKSKPEFPMADFALTGILAFFWLVCTLAMNSGGSAMKKTFDEPYLASTCFNCVPIVSSFMDLNIALLIGFLNCFLWTSDLWFLYKETIWFQNRGTIYNHQMYGQDPNQMQQQQVQVQPSQAQYVGGYDPSAQFGAQSSYEQQQQFTQQQQYGQQGGYDQYGQQQQYGQQYGQM